MNEGELVLTIWFMVFVAGCALAEILWFTIGTIALLFAFRKKLDFKLLGILAILVGVINPFTARVVYNNLVNYVGEL